MPKKKPIPAENSNNFFKAGWKPTMDFDHTTGTGEITHVGTDPNYASKTDEILKEW